MPVKFKVVYKPKNQELTTQELELNDNLGVMVKGIIKGQDCSTIIGHGDTLVSVTIDKKVFNFKKGLRNAILIETFEN